MYKNADKMTSYLNKRFIKLFNKAKSVSDFEELNIILHSYDLYNELDNITREGLILLGKKDYIANGGDESDLDIMIPFLLGLFVRYDPVTKYVYTNEVDRKRSRYAESLISSNTKVKEINYSLRLWSNMVRQYAIAMTDLSSRKAFEDLGYLRVEWVTEEDDRVCEVCEARSGKIYLIDKIPPKPHLGCRCYVLPVGIRRR